MMWKCWSSFTELVKITAAVRPETSPMMADGLMLLHPVLTAVKAIMTFSEPNSRLDSDLDEHLLIKPAQP